MYIYLFSTRYIHIINECTSATLATKSLQSAHYCDTTCALRYLKYTDTRPFIQQVVEANSKENIEAPLYYPFEESPASQGVSNAESVSEWAANQKPW